MKESKKITDEALERCTLWSVFKNKADEASIGQIKIIIENTIPLLKHTVRVFPTYTNHDNEHSFKILDTMTMLLGDKIEKLSSAESAILLLSAFWHDLGMICNDDDEIKNEEWFDEYLKSKNHIDLHDLNKDTVADYIRANHHNRLEKYIFDSHNILANNGKVLLIDGHDVIDAAYRVSVSHNHDTKMLAELKELSSNDGKDDFVFCAILLRLADIMDFDNDRTPESVYRFLGLDNPKNKSEEISDKEWQKHLDSLGFDYKNNILYFKATPKEPDIEHTIREFIKVIENELAKCKNVFNDYCHKWRDDFKLPYEIDISGINSKSLYEYGDYKFTFDNNQTLDLLTGNNIYSDKTIFIRELLQNSIDASLYRGALEKQKGNQSFKSKPINITDWYDKHGNYWIRFDDYGIGMDKYILLNYFTKIGRSFYESKDFNKEAGFTAISRFGIGILSCFMVADKIEVSTKKDGCDAIRFSIKSLHSYFITRLESQHKKIDPFPSADENTTEKYRKEIGTSIAIQIDFNKINRWFEIKKELERHIFYSPVEIQYEGEKVGTTLDELDKNPWIDKEIIVELSSKDDAAIKEFFELGGMKETFKIKITPVNLTQYSPTPKIKAQMVLVRLNTEFAKETKQFKYEISFGKSYYHEENCLQLSLRKRRLTNAGEDSEHLNVELRNYKEFKKINLSLYSKICHNGIFLGQSFSSAFNDDITAFIASNNGFAITHIYLSDEFRPIMNLSRSKETLFSYRTLSAANLLLSRFITQSKIEHDTFDCSLMHNRFDNHFLYDEIASDILLEAWKDEKILESDGKIISLNEVKEFLKNREKVRVSNLPGLNFHHVDYLYKPRTRGFFTAILLNLFTSGYIDENAKYTVESVSDDIINIPCIEFFPVGFFVKYSNQISHLLRLDAGECALNIDHTFSKWLIYNAKKLNSNYKGIFEDIKNIYINGRNFQKDITEKCESLLQLLKQLDPNIISDEIIESIK